MCVRASRTQGPFVGEQGPRRFQFTEVSTRPEEAEKLIHQFKRRSHCETSLHAQIWWNIWTQTQSFCPSFTLAGNNNNSDSLIIFSLNVFPDTGQTKRTCTLMTDACGPAAAYSLLLLHMKTTWNAWHDLTYSMWPKNGHACNTVAQQCRLLGRSRRPAPFFHYCFYSFDLTHIFLYKNSRQLMDNDFCMFVVKQVSF